MKAIIDINGLQAKKHKENNKRLETFLTILSDLSIKYEFSGDKGITKKELKKSDLLIITTRYPKRYCKEEIKNIYNYVQEVGSLLLMSNHGDWPDKGLCDTRKFDAELTSKFDVDIENTIFKNPLPRVRTTLTRKVFNNDHPIIKGFDNNPVYSIVINNCSSISSIKKNTGTPIVSLSHEMEDKKNGVSYRNRYFAVSLDENSELYPKIKGRVVIISDSGFIGTRCTNNPGPGLIEEGDNSIFIKNTLLWLLREN